jgi:hypothetical protein
MLMIMLTYGLIYNDKNLELRTLERVESAEEKNLVGAEITLLEKIFHNKMCKNCSADLRWRELIS